MSSSFSQRCCKCRHDENSVISDVIAWRGGPQEPPVPKQPQSSPQHVRRIHMKQKSPHAVVNGHYLMTLWNSLFITVISPLCVHLVSVCWPIFELSRCLVGQLLQLTKICWCIDIYLKMHGLVVVTYSDGNMFWILQIASTLTSLTLTCSFCPHIDVIFTIKQLFCFILL